MKSIATIRHRVVSFLRNLFGSRIISPVNREVEILPWKDVIPDAVIIVDEAGKIVDANLQAEKLFGYTREEMLGQIVEMLVPERFRGLHIEERHRYSHSPRTRPMGTGLDLRALKKDGTEFPVDISLSPIKTKAGLRVIAFIRDMSERERLIRDMSERERLKHFMENIVATVPSGLVVFGKNLKVLSVNRSFCEMFDVSCEQVEGKPVDEILKSIRFPEECCTAIVERQQFRNRECTIHSPVKGTMTVSLTLSKIAGGEEFLLVIDDVTERKHAEQALLESEERYRALFQQALIPVYIFDPRTKHLLVANSKFLELLGYTQEEVSNLLIYDFIAHDRESIDNYIDVILKTGAKDIGHRRWRRKDGTLLDMLVTATCIRQHGEDLISVVAIDITELKRTEEALRESELRHSVFIQQSSVGIYCFEHKQPIPVNLPEDEQIEQIFQFSYLAECNDAFAKMYGARSADELIGRLVGEFLDRSDPQNVQMLRNFIRSGYRITNAVSREFDLEGKVRYFLNNFVGIIENGFFLRTWGTQHDITEQKRAEEALQREAMLNASLVEVTKAINQTLDLNSLLDLIMEKVLELTNSWHGGLFLFDEKEGVLRLQASRGIAPEIAQSLTFKIGESIAGWVAETGQGVLIHDVENHPRFKKIPQPERFSSMITVPLIVRGKVFGTLGIDRLEGEEPLTETEFRIAQSFAELASLAIQNSQLFEEVKTRKEYLETILESSQDLIFTVKKDGTFGYANKRLKEILGYQFEEIQGRHFLEFIPPHLHQFMMKKWEELQQGIGGVYDTQVIKADGSIADCRVSHSKLTGRDEYLCILRDITELKRAEEEKRKLQEHLFQIQKMESIGTLASGIAHDFNNILGIIMGQAFLIEYFKNDPNKIASGLEAIKKATQRGAALVNQILTFARKTEFRFQTVQINDLISEVVKLMHETFPKTIVVSTDLQSDLPVIWADATQIHQVLLNLCVNARDAMPSGGTISITTRLVSGESLSKKYPRATAQNYIELQVRDTGVGMDSKTLERIFEPFFTTKAPGKGTGLGLSVALGIVEGHNGIIDVESQPGKGTTFFVYLPVKESTALEISPQEKVGEQIRGGTETILVVEDEEMLREFLKELLVSNGYTVFTAQDGEEALQLYRRHQNEIDVVLIDLGLPKMGGDELFKHLRELNPNVKVIIASGFIDPKIKEEMNKAGVKHIIQKPYLVNEVLQRIRDVVEVKD